MGLPQVKLRSAAEELRSLPDALRGANYNETSLSKLFGVFALSELDAGHLPHYRWICREDDSTLARLAALFLLQESMPRRVVAKLFSAELLTALHMCGVLHRESGEIQSNVSLYPCAEGFFFTDHWCLPGAQIPGHVYEIGLDSTALAYLTPRTKAVDCLDLCTGSGVHGILSARMCERSTVVDLNPRALEYTKLNAALNNVEVEAHLGDLYSPVKGRQFDLITVNPPFVATPDREMLIHRSPGETGEEVAERLLEGLPDHLRTGGLFSMILNYPLIKGDDYLDRLERWLGHTEGWLIGVVDLFRMELGAYIVGHMATTEDYQAEYRRYLESYERLGFEAIVMANVFVRKLDTQSPNVKVRLKSSPPAQVCRTTAENWLDCQERFHSKGFAQESWVPARNASIAGVWENVDSGECFIQRSPENRIPNLTLSGAESRLFLAVDGRRSYRELAEFWEEQGFDSEQFESTMRELGCKCTLS